MVVTVACRTGCTTQDHASWGACARDARIQIDRHALSVGGAQVERRKDARLEQYRSLRAAGVQPASTSLADVRAAAEYGGVPPTPVTASPPQASPPAPTEP